MSNSISKILAIVLRELRAPFTDRTLMILMFAVPLAIATIIAVTFGGVMESDAPLRDIPVAIVNQDQGSTNVNNGAVLVNILLPAGDTVNPSDSDATDAANCPGADSAEAVDSADTGDSGGITLPELIQATMVDDPAAARAGVEAGTYAAAIIIPADFTASLTYSATHPELTPTQIEVYGDPQRPIAAQIVRGVVENIAAQIGTGNVALAAALDTVVQQKGAVSLLAVTGSQAFQQGIACAFTAGTAPVSVTRQDTGGSAPDFNLLVFIGSSQAVFIALFVANGFANGVMEERRNWTLQRLLMTPTSRITILLGKMLATLAVIFTQLVVLLIGFSLIGSILQGKPEFIWGSDVIGILLVLVSVSLATAGIGSIVAAFARTPEQSTTIGSIIALAMAVTGGSFGFQLPPPLSYFSIIHWGSEAFSKVAAGQPANGPAGYLGNVVILLGVGAFTFVVALLFFNRRLEAAS